MSIQSVGSSITSAIEGVTGTKATGATTSSASTSEAEDTSRVSDPAKLMSKLKELQKSDPAKFKEVMAKISDSLKAKASATDDAGDKKALTEIASKFESAGKTGDLSSLAPPKGAGKGGHPHGGHGGPPPAAASSSAPTGSKTSTDPADANQDGTVTQKEKDAYAAAKAEKSAHAYAKTAGSHPPPPSEAVKSAVDDIGKIVDDALAA